MVFHLLDRYRPLVYTGINTLMGFSVLGAVAHLGERIPCTDEVAGSIPVSSTILRI